MLKRLTLWLARRLGLVVLDLDAEERYCLAGCLFACAVCAPVADREDAFWTSAYMADQLGLTDELRAFGRDYERELVLRN